MVSSLSCQQNNVGTESWKKLTLLTQLVNSRVKIHPPATNSNKNVPSYHTILSF